MTCQIFESDLPLHAGGDLPAEQAARLEQHLRTCATCRNELRSLRETREALRRADTWDNADEAALASVRAAVRRQVAELEAPPPTPPSADRPLLLRLRPLVAVAATLALALGLHLRMGGVDEQPGPSTPEVPGEETSLVPPGEGSRSRSPSPSPPAAELETPATLRTEPETTAPRLAGTEPPTPAPPESVPGSEPPSQKGGRVSAQTTRPETIAESDSPALEPAWIKLVSDDLVIYWLVDSEEEPEETSHVSTTS